MRNKIKKLIIKLILRVKRTVRFIGIMCPKTDIVIYFVLVCLWIVFGLFTNYIDYIHDGITETFLRTMWGLRNSIFTSIILSFAIGSLNRVKDYRKQLKRQHFLYVDSMDDFERLFMNIREDDIWLMFHALYNDRCLKISLEYVDELLSMPLIHNDEFLLSINLINERLKKIDDQLKDGMLWIEDEELLALEISEAEKIIAQIILKEDEADVKDLIWRLYNILDQLRFLWRKDIGLNEQLIQMASNPEKDFYMRMWLPNFGFEMIRNS